MTTLARLRQFALRPMGSNDDFPEDFAHQRIPERQNVVPNIIVFVPKLLLIQRNNAP